MKHVMKRRFIAICLIFVISASLWFFYPILSAYHVAILNSAESFLRNKELSFQTTNEHGGTYGGLEAFLSFFALIVTIYAFSKQNKINAMTYLAVRTPTVEWDAPLLQVIGISKKKLYLFLRLDIKATGDESARNFVTSIDALNNKSKVLFSCACSGQGSIVKKGETFICIHFAVIDDERILEIVRDGIVRKDGSFDLSKALSLRVTCKFTNSIGHAFSQDKLYLVDCPSSNDRYQFKSIFDRAISGWSEGDSDRKNFNAFADGLNKLTWESRVVFALPMAMSISKIASLNNAVESMETYQEFVDHCKRIIDANHFPINSCTHSFCRKFQRKATCG